MPDDPIKILGHMLDVAVFRHSLLSSNIANLNTPGYRAKDISFQDELNEAIRGGQSGFDVFERVATMPTRDGNTVNLNIEMIKVAENTLTFNAAAQLMSMKIGMTKNVIRGGR